MKKKKKTRREKQHKQLSGQVMTCSEKRQREQIISEFLDPQE